jgi:hypothetical protein
MTNLLSNPSFERETWHKTAIRSEFSNMEYPRPWIGTWVWRPDPTINEWDPQAEDPEWSKPECKVIPSSPPYDDPPRVDDGARAWLEFWQWRHGQGGMFQIVTGLTPGRTVRLTARAHAWASNGDDPTQSEVEGPNAAPPVMSHAVGLAPTDEETLSLEDDRIQWGQEAAIYDVYGNVPAVELRVPDSGTVTAVLKSTAYYRLKHLDAYWDAAMLEYVDTPGLEVNTPRTVYDRTYVLLPPGAGPAWAHAVIDATWEDHRFTLGGSADDAGFGLLDHRRVIAVNPSRWGDSLAAFFIDHYPGLVYTPVEAATPDDLREALAGLDDGDPDPLEPPPPTPPEPRAGSLMGFHTFDDNGITDVYREIAQHGTPPVIKCYGLPDKFYWMSQIKQIDPNIVTIGRLSSVPGSGVNVEGTDLSDPIAAAHAIYNVCHPVWAQHADYVDYWEVLNEPDPADHVLLADFYAEMIRLVRPLGLKLGLFSYSMGVPEKHEWAAIREESNVLDLALAEGHMIAIHEYGFMDQHYNWLVGRFEWMAEMIGSYLAAGLDVYVTEWNTENGLVGLWKSKWMSEVRRYDDLCRKYPWMRGVTIFTTGSGAASAWEDYDPVNFGWMDDWKAYVISQFEEG